jgi:hypothetical protein
MKAQVAKTVSPESGMLLKTIRVPAVAASLGATLGATRMNNLEMLRTRADNHERRARGHDLI